jgi:hypothetical protein
VVLGIDDSVAEDLRPKAKAVLEQMLDSEDESKRLAAARSLYSYQAVRPVDADRECTCFTKPSAYCSAVDEHGYRGAHVRGGIPTKELARLMDETGVDWRKDDFSRRLGNSWPATARSLAGRFLRSPRTTGARPREDENLG